jgi:hypothetical protein
MAFIGVFADTEIAAPAAIPKSPQAIPKATILAFIFSSIFYVISS